MKFISVEEFLKQEFKVQKVFLDWWKPSKGDLYNYHDEFYEDYGEGTIDDPVYRYCEINKLCMVNEKDLNENEDIFLHDIGFEIQPLLTEGQLRKFIEDKTGGITTIEHYIGIGQYDIKTLPLVDGIYENDIYEDLGDDLLQAYWKVAIEIAKHKTR